MTIGELKKIVDSMHELYGPDASADFVHAWASGRISCGSVTSFEVRPNTHVPWEPSVRFVIGNARGKMEDSTK